MFGKTYLLNYYLFTPIDKLLGNNDNFSSGLCFEFLRVYSPSDVFPRQAAIILGTSGNLFDVFMAEGTKHYLEIINTVLESYKQRDRVVKKISLERETRGLERKIETVTKS